MMDVGDRFDLSGRVFGRLTAQRCVEGQRSRAVWECLCECGRVKRASYHSLTQGLTKSCGCTRVQAAMKDLTGQKFGRLTAVERTGEKRGTSFVWRCLCDCGREALVPTNSLMKGNTKSCGCLQDEAKREAFHNIEGQRFGRLTAIAPLDRRSGGSVIWKCRCDCGRESEHAVKALTSGRARSCGCLKQENDALQRSLHYIDGTCVEFLENVGKLRSDNTSGHTGISMTAGGKFKASITFKKKQYYLGVFDSLEDALRARKRGEEMHDAFLEEYYREHPQRKDKRMAIGFAAEPDRK